SVCGAGDIGPLTPRLSALNARVANHWLSDSEIAEALAWAHIVAVTHTEASQSGVVAAAFGAGRPVVATPVGALAEQVAHERTGLVASRAEASAVAEALLRLANEPDLLTRLAAGVRASAGERSMQRFLEALQSA
ncbi:MAG TPA: glycosyltransferase, partial [Terricaulis sp.]|nr:glycosyltransferase [Terricaulis sp.]